MTFQRVNVFSYPLIRPYFLAVYSGRVYTYGNNNKGYALSSCILKEKGEYEIYYYILKHSVNMALMGCMGRLRCVCFRCLENQNVFRSCKYILSSFISMRSASAQLSTVTFVQSHRDHSLCVTSYNLTTSVSSPSSRVTLSEPNSHTQLCAYCRNSPSQNPATCFDRASIIRHIITKMYKST